MDLIDRANHNADLMLQVEIERRKKQQRMQTKSTGICVDCDSQIEPKRLNVNPCAQRCIECQKEHEGK